MTGCHNAVWCADSNVLLIVTHADGNRGGRAFTSICLVFPNDISKNDAARITKLDIFHDESWKPIYFGVKRSTGQESQKKTFNNVGLYTVVLVSYIYRPACDCTVTVHWLFWIWPTPFQQPGVSAQRVLLIISAIALHGKKRRVLEFCVTVDPVIRTAGICYSGLVG